MPGMMEAVACGHTTLNNNNNKYGWQQQQQQQQISDKFRQLCEARPGGEAGAMRSRADSLTLGRPEVRRPGAGGGYSHGTLPRGLGDTRDHRLSVSSHNLADVERLYMAMKNLSSPLPGARLAAEGAAMPAVAAVAGRGASMESLVCSVMGDIPPPPPPLEPAPAPPRGMVLAPVCWRFRRDILTVLFRHWSQGPLHTLHQCHFLYWKGSNSFTDRSYWSL